MNTYKNIFCIICIALLIAACDKAENYYQKLDAQPEMVLSSSVYRLAYGIGDTLHIRGRLNPENNLIVTIGGVKADLLSVRTNGSPVSGGDEVVILITEEMGIGENRPVTITSGDNTIDAPAIEIYEGEANGVLSKPLKAVLHISMPFTSLPLYCRSGNGTVYLWNTDNTITRIQKNGTAKTIQIENSLNDSYGPFNISKFSSGGIDPHEKYLYFSASTTDNSTDNVSNTIYRLCRFDLQTGTLTTLNRTLLPKASGVTLPEQVSESPIETATLYSASELLPDSKGNLIFTSREVGRQGVFRLTTDNIVRYLGYIGSAVGFSIDPEENLSYRGQNQYDITNQLMIYEVGKTFDFIGLLPLSTPYISGSFNLLTGNATNNSTTPSLFGRYPLSDEKLLILYYQNVSDYPHNKYNVQYPAWGVVDYKAKRGYRYAPKKFERGSYKMTNTDLILNIDEEGMIYMTANNRTVIVKTQYQ